jgi:predicted enzyme related to lactoylglutathione lyase
MPTRQQPPSGAPCWVDLWTSDVDGARRFYSVLFGWEALEPNPEFGGYFMWTREGAPIAGGMGDMPGMKATNVWTVYFATDDAEGLGKSAAAEGAMIEAPAMPVADLGVQVVLSDPTGAHFGAWQPGTFPGFTVLGEPGSPSWFELHTRDYPRALDFYRSALHLDLDELPGDHAILYSTIRNPEGGEPLGGLMDAAGLLPDGAPSSWLVYWEVEDVAATVEKGRSAGGAVAMEATETPFGIHAHLIDPSGAQFKLRGSK